MVTARARRRKWIEPQLDVLLDLHGELVLVKSKTGSVLDRNGM